jgi:hypothetical protein
MTNMAGADSQSSCQHALKGFFFLQDLNSSFSKLPPISKGKKVKAGKSQAFIVD